MYLFSLDKGIDNLAIIPIPNQSSLIIIRIIVLVHLLTNYEIDNQKQVLVKKKKKGVIKSSVVDQQHMVSLTFHCRFMSVLRIQSWPNNLLGLEQRQWRDRRACKTHYVSLQPGSRRRAVWKSDQTRGRIHAVQNAQVWEGLCKNVFYCPSPLQTNLDLLTVCICQPI